MGSLNVLYFLILGFSAFVKAGPVLKRTSFPTLCSVSSLAGDKQLVECNVRDGQFLDYRDVRDWTAGKPSSQRYHVSIRCYGGKIFLPWPYRAQRVVSLQVHDCHVYGMFSEWNKTNVLADELEYLETANIVVHSSIEEIFNRVSNINKLRPDYECGQQTLVTSLVRNVNYDFDITVDDFLKYQHVMDQLLTQDPNELFIGKRPKNYKCVYPQLRYLENSGNSNMAKLHFKIIEESTEYPALEVYDLSSNNFREIPAELRNIDFRLFPNLRKIDLSKNKIEQISFNFPAQESVQKSIFIDMSSNRIDSIPEKLVEDLRRNPNVIIDVRSNPLQCSCELLPFRQYISTRYSSPSLSELRDVTCIAPDNQNNIVTHSVMVNRFRGKFCGRPAV